jgi:uncharacterized membrane protein
VAGIRLRSTLRDDDSWRVAHEAAGPVMMATGLVGAVLSLTAGVIGAVFGETAAGVVVMAAAGVVLLGVLWSTRRGTEAVCVRRWGHR